VRDLDRTLGLALGAGEREAISLAAEIHADVLVLDDFQARSAATSRNLPVVGTLAVLREASLRGYLLFAESVERILECGFRVSAKTLADAMAEYEAMTRRQ
jgi:predicted nucleic acid-binding protein